MYTNKVSDDYNDFLPPPPPLLDDEDEDLDNDLDEGGSTISFDGLNSGSFYEVPPPPILDSFVTNVDDDEKEEGEEKKKGNVVSKSPQVGKFDGRKLDVGRSDKEERKVSVVKLADLKKNGEDKKPVQMFHSVKLNPNKNWMVEGVNQSIVGNSLFQKQKERNKGKSVVNLDNGRKNSIVKKPVNKISEGKIGNLANLLANKGPGPNVNKPKDKVEFEINAKGDYPTITVTETVEENNETTEIATNNNKFKVKSPENTNGVNKSPGKKRSTSMRKSLSRALQKTLPKVLDALPKLRQKSLTQLGNPGPKGQNQNPKFDFNKGKKPLPAPQLKQNNNNKRFVPKIMTFDTTENETKPKFQATRVDQWKDPSFDKQVFELINQARATPEVFVKHLQQRLTKFENNSNVYCLSATEKLLTHEGPAAVLSAIDFMTSFNSTPAPVMDWNDSIALACQDHVVEVGTAGTFTHLMSDGTQPTARVLKHLQSDANPEDNTEGSPYEIGAAAESIKFRSISPLDVVLDLIVDDGLDSRGNRKNLFNRTFDMFGCFTGEHKICESMTTLVFVQSKQKVDELMEKVVKECEDEILEPENWIQKQQEIRLEGKKITVTNVYKMVDGPDVQRIITKYID